MDFDIDRLMNARQGIETPESAALNSMKEEAEAAEVYLRRAKTVDDPQAREIYKDIAKEEATHMGEAAELLDRAAPDVAAEVPKGMEEAQEKIAHITRTPAGWSPDIDGTMGEMMERRH